MKQKNRKPNITYTEEQIYFIRKNYGTKTDERIGYELGLTKTDIQNFRHSNHLKKRGVVVETVGEGMFDVDAM